MVDFSKKLSRKPIERPTDPIKLYETLDREADKGPLRPAQIAVLTDWFGKHQGERDVIIKLHTGQGKTLIGLLMLQSRINAGLDLSFTFARTIISLSKPASRLVNLVFGLARPTVSSRKNFRHRARSS